MLKFTRAFSSFAVDDIPTARDFYGGTLGLEVSEEMDGYVLVLRLPGGRDTMLYAKPDHVPAGFTVLNFEVEDVEAAVDGLTAAGVAMERYDGFEQDEKGIARGTGPDIAWLRTRPATCWRCSGPSERGRAGEKPARPPLRLSRWPAAWWIRPAGRSPRTAAS